MNDGNAVIEAGDKHAIGVSPYSGHKILYHANSPVLKDAHGNETFPCPVLGIGDYVDHDHMTPLNPGDPVPYNRHY